METELPEVLGDLPQVTQLVCGRVEAKTIKPSLWILLTLLQLNLRIRAGRGYE